MQVVFVKMILQNVIVLYVIWFSYIKPPLITQLNKASSFLLLIVFFIDNHTTFFYFNNCSMGESREQ